MENGYAHAGNPEALSDTTTAARFRHEFSRVQVHAAMPAGVQTKLAVNAPGDVDEQEADRVPAR